MKRTAKSSSTPRDASSSAAPWATAASPAARSFRTPTAAWATNGGGAFSGKDPSKVDRSGAYMARYVAKNIVAARSGRPLRSADCLLHRRGRSPCLFWFTPSTPASCPTNSSRRSCATVFDLRPYFICKRLDLKRPIYSKTSCYGHFGREPSRIHLGKARRRGRSHHRRPSCSLPF